jgi:hypothetical protein
MWVQLWSSDVVSRWLKRGGVLPLQFCQVPNQREDCRTWHMQVSSRRRYTLFLQSRCGYACGDHERSASGQKRTVAAVHLDKQPFNPQSYGFGEITSVD